MADLADKMPDVRIDQAEMALWGERWLDTINGETGKAKSAEAFDRQQSVNFASFIDYAFANALGYNPRARTPSPILIAVSVSDADGFVRYGDSLVYNSTVSNNFRPGDYAFLSTLAFSGALTNTLDAALGGGVDVRREFIGQGEAVAREIAFDVNNGSGSRTANISSQAEGDIQAIGPFGDVTNIGRFDQTQSVALEIDDDVPTSSLTTRFVKAGAGQWIAGSATDPTSGIRQVDVSIDGGPWQVAVSPEPETGSSFSITPPGNGTYTWMLWWEVPNADGTHTIRTRATDRVGHVESPDQGNTIAIAIDAQAPSASAELPVGNIAGRSYENH